jgi:hypothetical protein
MPLNRAVASELMHPPGNLISNTFSSFCIAEWSQRSNTSLDSEVTRGRVTALRRDVDVKINYPLLYSTQWVGA